MALLISLFVSAAPSPSDAKGSIKISDFDEANTTESQRIFDERVAAGDKTVLFEIDSHGGEVEAGMDLIHHIREEKRTHPGLQVVCVINWKAYSMGFFFLQGACDQRLATVDATLMTHEVAGGVQGKADQFANAAATLEALNDSFASLCAQRMKISKEEYRRHVAHNDWWMSADAALKLNAIDGITDDLELPPPFEYAPKADSLDEILHKLTR